MRRCQYHRYLYCSLRSHPKPIFPLSQPLLPENSNSRHPTRGKNYNSQRALRSDGLRGVAAEEFFKVRALVCYWLSRRRGHGRSVAVIGRQFLLLKIPEEAAEPAQFTV